MTSSLFYYLSSFAGKYFYIYPIIVVLLIITYLFVKPIWKNEIRSWLYVFNTVILWFNLISIINYVTALFMAWYGQNPYEWYAFSDSGIHFFRPYEWSYWLMLGGGLLLPQLYWLKKLRKSVGFTFFIVAILSFGAWFERIVIYITSAYRDYLPSSWSTYPNDGYLIQVIISLLCFILVSVPVYWIMHKRKKLPFPSAILPYSLFFIPYSLFHCTQLFN